MPGLATGRLGLYLYDPGDFVTASTPPQNVHPMVSNYAIFNSMGWTVGI